MPATSGCERPNAHSQTSHAKRSPKITASGTNATAHHAVEHDVADRGRTSGGNQCAWVLRADEDEDAGHADAPGDDREVHEDEHPVVGLAQRAEQASRSLPGSNGARSASRSTHVRNAQSPKPPRTTHQRVSAVVLEALGERGARDAERLVGLLGELVEVVVKHGREEQRAEPHRDRGVRAPLEVADGDGARGGAESRRR